MTSSASAPGDSYRRRRSFSSAFITIQSSSPLSAEGLIDHRYAGLVVTVAADPLAGLLQGAVTLLAQLSQTAGPSPVDNDGADSGVRVVRDAPSGRSYLQLALPEPEVLQQAVDAFSKLLAQMTRQK